ncbi:hypothetical protein VOLCADRAFT_121316 [Volvox carteri f. nagariensis]|uniref:Nucleolar complex-associated protein 3 N-terminal domain-containing protein n=1 Tax=Volvox carteri f. nagariensis TaxID=3068 RepID=D8U7A0_VOLCA|nr:uncharacterized protein VOLCADRAFT_121316 [Volvox carteri f. nagariensis]EFJ44448.1 hypothetical protein VOLCADRAFT_121316 [Volvox carteri f. nagariensis]|eukprot:XP_002954555.1 hypothetical protein VOLCADRAFT_121316 [Volvox carteri f. nagariensis]
MGGWAPVTAVTIAVWKKSGGGGAALQDVPLVTKADDSDASDLEISEEDLEFVEKHRRRLGFLEKLDQKELDKSIRDKQEQQAKEAAAARQKAAAAAAAAAPDAGGSDDADESDDDAEEQRADGDMEEEEEEVGDEEAAYEKAPRRVREDPRGNKAGSGLPIKTLTGNVLYDKAAEGEDAAAGRRKRGATEQQRAAEMEAALAAAAAIQVEGVTITDDMEAALADSKRKATEEEERRAQKAAKKAAEAARKAEESSLPPALRGLQLSSLTPSERRSRLQEVMAAAANQLLTAPESRVGELRTLQALVGEDDSMTSRLALLSLYAVFKDILPGYRIRPPSEKEMEVKVSKEVAKLREYEQTLLKSYQTYLRSLLDASRCVERGTGTLSHARVAVRCLAGLLTAHPHFNYTSDILQAIVPRMSSSDPEIRSLACEAVRVLLLGGSGGDEGGAGKAALEAVQLIADMIRKRKCVAPPETVRTLSVLKFLDVVRQGGGEDEEAGPGGKRKKGRKAEKRDAKRRRKEDDVTRTFKESSAGPDREEMARIQSSMLEALFEIYFRVLKHCCAVGLSAGAAAAAAAAAGGGGSGDGEVESGGGGGGPRVPSAGLSPPWSRARLLKRCPLLLPVLDGLARYTHLISVDYMNDLLAVFNELLAAPALPLPERLRLLATQAALLRGQGEALNVDRRELYVQLYDTLLQVPFHSLVTDDATNRQAQHAKQDPPNSVPPAADKATSNGIVAGAGDEEGEDDNDEDIVTAAACDQAVEAAAAPPPPPSQAGTLAVAADSQDQLSFSSSSAPSVAVLLAGVLESLLCEPKMADMQRTAAFVKRMASTALLAGPGEAMALWAAIGRLLRRYPKLAHMLEYEGEAPTVGGRTYDPYCADPSEGGGLATTLWEICLVSGCPEPHYHPHLAQAAGSLLALRPGAAAAAAAAGGAVQLTGPLGTPATITELAAAYDASRGLVRPPPPPPAKAVAGRKGRAGRRGGAAAAAATAPPPEFFQELEALVAEYGTADGWDGPSDFEAQDDEACDADEDGPGRDNDRTGQAAASGPGPAGAAAARAALRGMFLESRRFHRNKQLRLDKALLVEQLKRFHIHLQKRQVAEAEAAAAAAAAAAKASAAVAAKGKNSGGVGGVATVARSAPAAQQQQQHQKKGGKAEKRAAERQHDHQKQQHSQQVEKPSQVGEQKKQKHQQAKRLNGGDTGTRAVKRK